MDDQSNTSKINSLLITGTKGKTTVCNMINHIITSAGKNSLLVDTLGSKFNNVQITNYDDSLKNFGKSPNVMPGRFLYWNMKSYQDSFEDFYAILEASLGCYKWGTGIDEHKVGIFTNVYRDHIDFDKIKDENDIYERKSFVFKQLAINGSYIAFLDNPYTLRSLTESIIKEKNINAYGVSISKSIEELKTFSVELGLKDIFFFNRGTSTIDSLENGMIYDLNSFKYFQNGDNEAMITNAALSIAYALLYLPKDKVIDALNSYLIPEEYGRFLVFKKDDRTVTIDYAHEPQSLKLLIEQTTKLTGNKPYLLTRLASDRNNQFIKEYAQEISQLNIAGLTIFDKIDGINSKVYIGRKIRREIGESSQILFDELSSLDRVSYPFKRIVNEIDALEDSLSNNKDIVIIYSNLPSLLENLKSKGFERAL